MIKFIREYICYNVTMFDIIYSDGQYVTRVRTVGRDDLPKTALNYMQGAVKTEILKTRYESEYIYERKEA